MVSTVQACSLYPMMPFSTHVRVDHELCAMTWLSLTYDSSHWPSLAGVQPSSSPAIKSSMNSSSSSGVIEGDSVNEQWSTMSARSRD